MFKVPGYIFDPGEITEKPDYGDSGEEGSNAGGAVNPQESSNAGETVNPQVAPKISDGTNNVKVTDSQDRSSGKKESATSSGNNNTDAVMIKEVKDLGEKITSETGLFEVTITGDEPEVAF